MDYEADHDESDHGFGHFGQVFVVLGQAPPATEPAECPFDDRPYNLAWLVLFR